MQPATKLTIESTEITYIHTRAQLRRLFSAYHLYKPHAGHLALAGLYIVLDASRRSDASTVDAIGLEGPPSMHRGCQRASQKSRPPKHISCRVPSLMVPRQMKHTVPLTAGLNVCSFTTSVLVVLHCGQPLFAAAVWRHWDSQFLCACTLQTKHTHLSCSVMGSVQKRHSPPLERDLGGVRLLNLFPRNMVRL